MSVPPKGRATGPSHFTWDTQPDRSSAGDDEAMFRRAPRKQPPGRRPSAPRTAAPISDSTAPVTVVSLSAGLGYLAASLASILGAEFTVCVDGHDGADVVVVGPVGTAGVAVLALRYRMAGLVVVVPGRVDATAAVAYLDAGADDFVATGSVVELAAHIVAVGRRCRPTLRVATTAAAAPSGPAG